MPDININLCQEVINEFKRLGLSENKIDIIKNNPIFIEAYDKHYTLQRTMLTTLLFKILLSASFNVPSDIRLALNIGNDVNSWLDDIKLVVIPFIIENNEKMSFFH